MVSLQASLYSIALALCVFCTGLLSQRRTRSGFRLRMFRAYLGIESVGFALELLSAHPDAPFKSLWLGLLLAISLLTAPLLWLAVRETVTGETPRLSELTWPHWTIIATGVLCAVPLIANAHSGPEWANPSADAPAWHFYLIHETMLICIGLFALQAPFYLRRTLRLLRAHTLHAPCTWLHLPLIVVATTWALGILRTAQCAFHAPAAWLAIFAVIDVSVTIGALYLIVRREFQPDPIPEAIPAETPAPKYAKSQLEKVHVARIRRKLDAAFSEQQFHRDSLLNLRSLSRAIGEKPHYVSQVINQELGITFYDMVNRQRVNDARRLLVEQPNETILEIALAIGFNSKSTFNTAFKRHAGATPSEYRARTPRD